MKLSELKDVSYFNLNNQINRPVDGVIPLGQDKKAIKAFFKENVIPCTLVFDSYKDKVDYLLKNNYLDPKLLELYTVEEMNHIIAVLNAQNFRFKSFMSAYKFYQQYALKTDDGEHYLESIEERVAYTALDLAKGDLEFAEELALEMIHQRYQPATPTFLSSGKARTGEKVSCFLLDVTDDMNSIGRSVNSGLQLSRIGGGVGFSLSNLREAGAPIKGIENAASGVVPVMKIYEDAFSYSNQLGQRQGAAAVYLNIFHPDIVAFLSTKKENADEKIRVKTLSLGLVVPDKFYELARLNQTMHLFSPYSVEKVYGKPFSQIDITELYDEMVANPLIRKYQVEARWLEEEISKLQQESGYPYILNVDTANRANAVPGKIIMSNLCSEILQSQQPSVVSNDQTYQVLGEDISCNLGSTNVMNLMKSPDFGKSVKLMLRALDAVSEESDIDVVPTVANGNANKHAVGLGALGLHTFLANNHIMYGSSESIEFTNIYFMLLNYWTLVASNELAKEKGSFKGFEDSDYANGKYFKKYISENYSFQPHIGKVKELFENIFIPKRQDWEKLAEDVAKYGLRNAYRLAVAPTGSISYVNDASASIHPIVNRIEERQEKKIGKIYYPAFGLSTSTIPYYKSAYDIDMRDVIDVYAAATQHVDQGLSLTLFLRSEIPQGLYEWKAVGQTKQTTRDLSILRNYAFNKGIKSIYYVRTFTDDSNEIGSNQCESCSI